MAAKKKAKDKDRPGVPKVDVKKLEKDTDGVLKHLLEICLNRLAVNVAIEEKTDFVYPEGTAITKLILQIESELYMRKKGASMGAGDPRAGGKDKPGSKAPAGIDSGKLGKIKF